MLFLGLEYFGNCFCGILNQITNVATSHPIAFIFLAPLTSLLLYKTLQYLVSLPRVGSIPDRYVLVTGCGRGFGNDIAKRLDSLGCHVFAGCRSERGLKELDSETSERCHVIRMDVSSRESVREALQYVRSKLPPRTGLWGVVNNAGIGGSRNGPVDWLTLDDYREVFEVNLLGSVDVAMTFLPLIKLAKGRIINMSSAMAITVTPFAIDYAVTKFGVEGFSDGLRRSLRPFHCKVIVLEPGMFKTHMVSEEYLQEAINKSWNELPQETRDSYGEDYVPKYIKSLVASTDVNVGNNISHVSDAVEQALFSRYPRARYPVGNDAKYLYSNVAALPDWISDWIMERIARIPVPKAALMNQGNE